MKKAMLLAALLAGCSPPPWGVVLIVPGLVPDTAEFNMTPVYQLSHVGIDYPSRGACEAVWGDRCAQRAGR